jgi:hypothetical protein
MRKRRAIIFRNEPPAKSALKRFFEARVYETLIFREPVICPVYGNGKDCKGPYACSDIMITSHTMPKMSGVDLFIEQQRRGCKLDPRNKAIIAGSLSEGHRAVLIAWGSAIFQKPLDLSELEKWVNECETRMDLTRPIAIRRREERQPSRHEVLSVFLAGRDIGRVTVVNKSNCGICFKTPHRLLPNQVITIQAHSSASSEEALVRWVRAAGDGIFVVGLSFCI